MIGTGLGAVVGHVWDLAGEPQSTAFVELVPKESPDQPVIQFADSLGAFRFQDVPNGEYVLRANRLPRLGQSQDLFVLPGVTDTVCMALRSRPMALQSIR